MLGQTLNASKERSAAAAVGGGRDGVRSNGGSPASAAPLPPNNTEIDPLATYTRRSSETSCIFYSGYLLKRSNAPLDISRRESDKESGSSDAGSRGGAPLVPEETLFVLDNCGDVEKSGQSKNLLRLPVPPLTGSAESEDKAVQAKEVTDLVAALSFGLDINKPSAQDVKAATKEHVGSVASTSNEKSIEPEVDVPTTLAYTATTPKRSSAAIPIPSSANNKQAQSAAPVTPPYHRLNSAPAGMETNVSDGNSGTNGSEFSHKHGNIDRNASKNHTSSILQTTSQQSAPADYIAPDGHIWRAKYCVLEDGVLYFYRNEQDGNSIEAQVERQEMSLFHANANAAGPPSSLSSRQQEGRSASHQQLEDLSKSPGPRQFQPSLLDSRNTTGATSFCHDGTVLWEKRVALDHVGEVRSAEMEYGAKSFELLAVGYEDNPNTLGESQRGDNMADRLILRASSKEDMNEWLFQFHRSLASFMKQIVNMVGSNMAGVGDLHLPEQFYPNYGIDVAGALIPPVPQTEQNIKMAIPIPVGKMKPPAPRTKKSAYDTVRSYSPGSQLSSLFPESALSHGHGRSGMHRRRVRTRHARQNSDYVRLQSPSPLLSPGPSPEQDKIISASMGRIPKKGSLAFSLQRDMAAPGSPPKDSSPNAGGGFAPHPPRVKRISPANKDIIDDAVPRPLPSTGKYIPPHLRPKPGGAYIPPHLRNKDSGQILNPVKPPSEVEGSSSTVSQFDWTGDEMPGMNRSDGFGIENSMESLEDELPTARLRAPSDIISPHFILGGCADPTAAIGSIQDEMYVPRKASRVGKFHTRGHGGYGGQSSGTTSGSDLRPRSGLRWEVGAMSECGIRESNEDAYIISHDLSAAFSGWRDHHDGSSSLFDAEHYGLFAIFDGHCGNHAARYATEKLPGLLFDEYKKLAQSTNSDKGTMQQQSEAMLTGAIQRLDEAFCTLCYAGGRDWESGATALVVLLIDDLVTVANLGDSRGVMCISREYHKGSNNDDQWYILENSTSPGENAEQVGGDDILNNRTVWKEITSVHSPGRDDERERIESANGWITTETEIPISQLQRIDFLDADVVEILQRCFSDRFDDSDPSADVHRAGKQCHAEPGRLLHISRVCGELAVSRAIGDRDFKAAFNRDMDVENGDDDKTDSVDETGWESPLFLPYPDDHSRRFEGDLVSNFPEFQHHTAGADGHSNEFLLLACDGLWDVMDADDALRVAQGLLFEKEWTAQKVAARLAELAMHLGSSDNITVIVVRFFTD